MSAIAGICYWDGRPIADSELAIMASHSRAGGPHGGGTISPQAGLALQAHVLHFDRLSTQERQPYGFDRGSVLTWDGRLDNREDLLISLDHDLGDDQTDAALVAAAFTRWGLDSIPRLIGDWSLAIWDAPNRRLVLARDYMGNRPLHYLELPNGIAWASSVDALAECFDLYRTPNESFIAGKLMGTVPRDLTPFTGVRLLRAGHWLLASQMAGAQIRRYWTYQPSQIRYRDPRDYTDHLRSLLTEAVRVRLRASGRVWSHLSGGFDSSSIVCLAQTLIQRGQVEAPALQPVSTIVSASPESDESVFIAAVERWCGLTSIKQEFTDSFPRFSDYVGRRRPFSYAPGETRESPMVAAGDRVVLSGQMGDLVMLRGSQEAVSLVEPLHEGRLLEFLRLSFARSTRRRMPLPSLFGRLVLLAYFPSVDLAIQQRRERARRAKDFKTTVRDIEDRGVTPEVVEIASRLWKDEHPSVQPFPIAKRRVVEGLYRFTDHPAITNPDYTPEIWRTFPFSHRTLVEFIVAVPQLSLWDPSLTRSGMKRALATVLPPQLLQRTSKGEPATAQARMAITRADARASMLPSEPPMEWHLVKKGYVRAAALQRDIDTLASGTPRSEGFLKSCIQLEAWLRTVNALADPQGSTSPRRAEISHTLHGSEPWPATIT